MMCYVYHGSMMFLKQYHGWGLNGHVHSAAVSALGLYAPRFPLTPWIFSQYYELWMVKDLNSLQSCAEKHCLWTDWQFSHKVWHKVVNHDPSLLAKTKPLVDAPFILNLDNLTCYQLNVLIVEPSRTVLLVTFSVLFCLCPNLFLSVLQASHSVVFYIYKIQLGLSVKTRENIFSVLLSC